MDGVNLSIHSVSSRRSPIPAVTGQKTVVKLKDRTFELHFSWLVNTFYTFLDTFIDRGSPVWYTRVVKERKKWQQRKRRYVYKGTNEDWRCRRKEMKVGVNWQRQMQMVAFMLITVICFFMPVRTRPGWASSQPSACSALITVRRSFIWRTFIYSFNFLSFMCSSRTPHHSDMGVCRLVCTANFW